LSPGSTTRLRYFFLARSASPSPPTFLGPDRWRVGEVEKELVAEVENGLVVDVVKEQVGEQEKVL